MLVLTKHYNCCNIVIKFKIFVSLLTKIQYILVNNNDKNIHGQGRIETHFSISFKPCIHIIANQVTTTLKSGTTSFQLETECTSCFTLYLSL